MMLRSTVRAVDLATYRAAVADLVAELSDRRRPDQFGADRLAERLAEPEFAAVLGGDGPALIGRLGAELRSRLTDDTDPAILTRTVLLAQIDAVWWGASWAYRTEAELRGAPDLVDIARFGASVRYRRQPLTLVGRAARAAHRRIRPDLRPHTAGLRSTRVRPALARLAAEITAEYDAVKPDGSPPLWVTSLTRSVAQQYRLLQLGYPATLPSAHCVGLAMDVEMAWLRRFGADAALRAVLLDRQRAGNVNVIDEGQTWHVCISPAAVARREVG